ncbi:MAG: gliding motility-associated C-terminal domain-containing protein, partial [Bacteroidia bacterium]
PAVDILSASITYEDSATVVFKKSSSSDVKDYLIIALEYKNGILENTDINNYTLTGNDTFSVTVETPKTDSSSYCFGVIAVDSCGQNFSKNDEIHCPSFLTGFERNLSNRLTWTNYSGFNVDSFIVEINDNGVWKTESAFNRIQRSVNYNNLGCNVPIEYRLKIKEQGSGATVYSNDVILTPFDSIKPQNPIVNYTTIVNDTLVEINWDKSVSNDVYKYRIDFSTNQVAFFRLDSFVNNASNNFTFKHTWPTKFDTLSYRIFAIDSCSESNISVNNKLQTAVQLSGEGANQENNLRWNGYKGFDVKAYEVETYNKTNNQWDKLTTLNANSRSYIHENLYCFDTITYRIKALDNNSNFISYSDTIKLKPFDTISPIPPVIKHISAVGIDSIEIAWNRSTSSDANKYVLFRKSATTSYLPLDTLLNEFTYLDEVSTDSTWIYALIAIDSCTENSSYYKSNPASNIVLTNSQFGCESKIQLNWNAYYGFDAGLQKYELNRSIDGKPFVKIADLTNTTLQYVDNVSQHHKYIYTIKAIENGGLNEAFSQPHNADIYTTAVPRLLTASIVESKTVNGEIEIIWEKQEGQRQVEYSRLYYKQNASANFTLLKDKIPLSDSAFTHTGLNTKIQTHQYFIVNVDSCSAISDTLSIHKTIDMDFGYGQLVHNLSWTPYEGFNVERYILQQFIGGAFTDIDTVDGNSDKFNRFPAPCNTPIIYRIAAEDIDGYQAYSDTTIGTAIDLTSPDAPVIRNLTVLNDTSVAIDFRGVDSLDTYGYAIQKSKNGGPFLTETILLFSGQKQLSNYLDTLKLDGNTFAFKVTALDSCLNATSSNVWKPIALNGKPGNFENHLSWHQFVGYPVDSYIVEYQVGNFWAIAGSTQAGDTTFTHTQVNCNRALTYRIRADQNGGAFATISNSINLTPFDTIAPSKPLFYSASAINDSILNLNWQYDSNSDIKYYTVEKFENGNWTFKDSVIQSANYFDTVLNATDSIYTYRINAIDSCNNTHISPYSDTITNFIFTYKLDTCDPTSYLKWTKPEGLLDSIDRYYISRSVDGKPFRIIDTVNAPTLSFADTNVTRGASYSYRIVAAYSKISQNSQTDTQVFVQNVRPFSIAPKLAYTTVTKTGDVGGEIKLVWNKITKAQDSFIIGYRVFGADTIKANYNLIAELNSRNDTSLIHSTANLTKYNYYRVAAINTCKANGDSSLLTAPVQLDVENLNLSSNLSWSEYFGFNAVEYRIYSSVGGAPFSQIGTVPSNVFTFKDSTVGCGESINFKVAAVSKFGYLAESDEENVIGFDTTLPAPTTLEYVTVNGTDLELNWNKSKSNDAKFYTITKKRFNDNIWDTLVDNVAGLSYSTNSIAIPVNNPWQFRVYVTDSCGNSQPTPSPEHHMVAIEALKQGPNTQVQWMNYKGWPVDEFKVYRDGSLLATMPVNKPRFDSLFSYIDTTIGCDSTIYDYTVEAVSNTLGYTSKSNNDTTWGIDRSTPALVSLISASVLPDNSGVRLNWTKSGINDVKYYQVLRKTKNDDEYSIVKRVNKKNDFTIDTVDMSNFTNYCYKIAVEDDCSNQGVFSNEGCPMVLKGGNLVRANSIKWNAYTTWADSIDYYEIYRGYDSVNLYYLKQLDTRIRTYVDTNLNDSFFKYCYRIKAVEKQGVNNSISWSNMFCTTQEPTFYISTAFTPELSEGTNDFFGPKGSFIPDVYTMKIFNRWGQKVYNGTGQKAYHEWNGIYDNGKEGQQEVYNYFST